MVIAGLITIPVIGISVAKAFRAYRDTYRQLAFAIVTVMAVLGLAYVMNASDQTATLGTLMAGAGAAFAILSPILGWLGVGGHRLGHPSNSLFGALQVSAANQVGLSPALMAAANSSGGVLGKMISPHNLAIAAAAGGMSGKEGDIFREVVGWGCGLPGVRARDRLSAVDSGPGLDAALRSLEPTAAWHPGWIPGARPPVGSDHRTLPYVHAVLRSASSSSTGRRSEARLVPMSAAAPMGGYRADERPEACHCSNAGASSAADGAISMIFPVNHGYFGARVKRLRYLLAARSVVTSAGQLESGYEASASQ